MFDSVLGIYVVLALAAALLGLGLMLESKRPIGNLRKMVRSLAVIGLVGGLLGIVFKPQTSSEINPTNAIYLTEGYAERSLDSLLRQNKQLQVFSSVDVNSQYQEVVGVNHLMSITTVDTLIVLGTGLARAELPIQRPMKFIPAWPKGIIGVDFSANIRLRDSVEVTLFTSLDEDDMLILSSPSSVIDSAQVNTGMDTVHFVIHPELPGKFIYTISNTDSLNPIQERIAFEVEPNERYGVLILNEQPNFESRYLKSWLAQAGHEVTVRNKVSKQKYRFEYLNGAPRPYAGMDASFDVVIMDAASFIGLSKSGLARLTDLVEQGMGVFIQADMDMLNNRSFQSWFEMAPSSYEQITYGGLKLPKLARQFEDGRFNVPVALDIVDQETVIQKRLIGQGAIMVSLIQQTFPLLLQGEQDSYDRLWQQILAATVAEKPANMSFQLDDILPRVDEQTDFSLTLGAYVSPFLLVDSVHVPLYNDISVAYTWHGRFWANNAGWVPFTAKQDTSEVHWQYIYDRKAWQEVNNYQKAMQTSLASQTIEAIPSQLAQESAISMWIWFALVLFCLSLLWLEPKF